MKWQKKGLIFKLEDHHISWAVSHACVPTAFKLDDNTIRIFFAPRNNLGQSIPTYFDVEANNPANILYVHKEPILQLGELGTFDDGGIMPCCIVPLKDRIYLYYVGWNPSGSVPYRNAIGLAESFDNGRTFERVYKGAIVDRSRTEPFFTASPWIMKEGDVWHMWYASSTGFFKMNEQIEPLYIIKYARSRDGVHWVRENKTCINPKHKDEANARATVIKIQNTYHMWFAYRGSKDFRDGSDAYKIGFATSEDAISWKRADEEAGINYSKTGWDSTMQTYPCVIKHKDKTYLFYNGNGFGKTGIGYAELEN